MILNRDFSGQIVNSGFQYVAPLGDSTPDSVTGQAISNAQLSTWIEFSPVQVTGINVSVVASIANGEMRVSVDGVTYGAYSAANQDVENTYWIQVRVMSPSALGAYTLATLTVSNIDVTFRVNSQVGTLNLTNASVNKLTSLYLPLTSRHIYLGAWTKY